MMLGLIGLGLLSAYTPGAVLAPMRASWRAAAPPRAITSADDDDETLSALKRRIESMQESGMRDSAILQSEEVLGPVGSGAVQELKNARAMASARAETATPTRGSMAWGAWSHSDDVISLEMYLDEGAKTRDVCVEVVEGWLLVRIDASQAHPARDRRRPAPGAARATAQSCYRQEYLYEDGVWGGEEVEDPAAGAPPLLFGRLAQRVAGAELMWGVEEVADGRRLLCIELPKVRGGRQAAVADCVFDETLCVRGEPCLAAGLSQGRISIELPDAPGGSSDADGAAGDATTQP